MQQTYRSKSAYGKFSRKVKKGGEYPPVYGHTSMYIHTYICTHKAYTFQLTKFYLSNYLCYV